MASPFLFRFFALMHKAGFVNILGYPNVGKSTLMNALVGERLSVINSKAQTTRHRIMGIVNGDDYQLVFSDTPGILKPKYKLQEKMMDFVSNALTDADVFLLVTDITSAPEKSLELIPEKLKSEKTPLIILINKIDISNQGAVETHVQFWKKEMPHAQIYPVSAQLKFNLGSVLDNIVKLIPECPPYFDKDQLTDKPERFFVTEIVRGRILELYSEEVPYSVELSVEYFKDQPEILKISVTVYVNRESQKAIIIGKGGQAIKKLGMASRKDLEEFFQKKIFLELNVKVSEGWRDNDQQLKRFGYDNK